MHSFKHNGVNFSTIFVSSLTIKQSDIFISNKREPHAIKRRQNKGCGKHHKNSSIPWFPILDSKEVYQTIYKSLKKCIIRVTQCLTMWITLFTRAISFDSYDLDEITRPYHDRKNIIYVTIISNSKFQNGELLSGVLSVRSEITHCRSARERDNWNLYLKN